jgi:hypothetical protein
MKEAANGGLCQMVPWPRTSKPTCYSVGISKPLIHGRLPGPSSHEAAEDVEAAGFAAAYNLLDCRWGRDRKIPQSRQVYFERITCRGL